MKVLWLDDYERRARLAPALLALLPVIVTIGMLGYRKHPAISSVAAALAITGGPIVLAELVRDQGRRAQKRLWTQWGGPPVLRLLQLRDSRNKCVQRDRWRWAISYVTGIQLSSRQSERRNPLRADEKLETAVGQLRSLTRDIRKFPLVHSENKSYGFHRNVYAIRHPARSVCGLATLGIATYMLWLERAGGGGITGTHVAGLAASLMCLIGWLVLPSARRTQEAAERYAHELLQSATVLAYEKEQAANVNAGLADPPV